MPLRKGQRRVLLALGLLGVGLLLAWFSAPLWFPWLLRPLARRQGLTYAAYQREGYRHFALEGIRFTNASVHFQADRLQALTPTSWLWQRLVGRPKAGPQFAALDGWRLESIPSSKPSTPPYTECREWSVELAKLGYWLPSAALSNGTIVVGKTVLGLPAATWAEGKLTASLTLPERQRATLSADLGKPGPWLVQLNSETLHLDSGIRVALTGQSLDLQGTFFWWSNRVEITAQFGQEDRLPTRAKLQASDFRVPAQVLELQGYRDLSGSCSLQWEHGKFGLDLKAGAYPLGAQAHLPPLNFDLHAYGDTNSAVVQSARLVSPWLKAQLSKELTLHATGPLLREPARLQVSADLGKQPWLPVEGTLTGEADFSPTGAKLPLTRFRLSGRGVGTTAAKAKTFQCEGNLDWPWLEVRQAKAVFEDGSVASTEGRMHMVEEAVVGGRFEFSGPVAGKWLPPGYTYQALAVSGDFHGPLKDLAHHGNLRVRELNSPWLKPLDVKAEWNGHEQDVRRAQVVVTAGGSALQVRGSLALGTNQTTLQLTNLTLLTNGQPALELQQPCRIALNRAAGGSGWYLSATSFDWTGTGGQVHAGGTLNWPNEGALWAAVETVSPAMLNGFSKSPFPEFHVDKLKASANWTNGPVSLGLELAASGDLSAPQGTNSPLPFRLTNSVPLSIEASLAGDPNGISLSNLVVRSQASTLTSAHGFLPLTFTPGTPGEVVHLEPAKPLRLEVAAGPQALFWDELAAQSGVQLNEPDVKLNLSGTWQAPLGAVELRARQIRFQKGPPHLPALRDLEVTLKLDRQQARLTEARVFAQGQPVLLTAELPLGDSFWKAVKGKTLWAWIRPGGKQAGSTGYLEHVRAHLLIQNAELAAFADLFPQVLSPQGGLAVDLSLEPGLKLAGELRLSHARTRPLGNLGPLRDIEVRMRFLGRTLELERASAGVGGTTVTAMGRVDLRGTQWMQGGLPPFQFTVRGTNVPLSRQVESIIRSDLDLALTHTNGMPPLISGTARLRDSYYLSDLSALVPGKVATPRRRPPYFSVEDPMLADWRLNVRVAGPHFLKVLSPLFNGEVAADLSLQGTLKDPIALGDLKIDSGLVRFPFASFQVRQGLVTLSSQNPYRPQLSLTAASRQYGYDLRMEVSGPVDTPVLQFTSIPPLASEQILLMVTAGELPRNELALTPQQKAQTVAMFLGRDLLSKLGYGDQAEQRLTIQSGQDITDQGRPTYNVEYKLSKRWSVEGEYDRFGDFNAGFKWRIYSK